MLCPELRRLDDMTDPFRDNPFRVLGLPGEASWPEITRAAERIRGLTSWGAYRTPWDLPWLHPVRREPAHADAALARLSDADSRLRHRLFWFHERDAESAVGYLTPASIRDALEGWSATTLPVARHDAAVVALLAALSLDPRGEDLSLWRRTLATWRAAVECDDYWLAMLKTEAEGQFDPPASLGAMNDLREDAVRSAASVLIAGARTAWADGDGAAPTRALAVLRDVLPSALFESLGPELSRPADAPDSGPELPAAEVEREAPDEAWALRRREVLSHLSRLGGTPAARGSAPPIPVVTPSAARPAGGGPHIAPSPLAAPPIAHAPSPGPPVPASPRVEASTAQPPLAEVSRPAEAPTTQPPPTAASPGMETPVVEASPDTEPPAQTDTPPSQPGALWSARPQRRFRRVLVAVIAAVVAAFLLDTPLSRPGEGHAPEPRDQRLLDLVERLEAGDEAIAPLLLERAESAREKAFYARRVRDYAELLADYDWRIANGLMYDLAGHSRVRRALTEALESHRLATERQQILAGRYDRLVRLRQRMIAEYNAQAMTVSR